MTQNIHIDMTLREIHAPAIWSLYGSLVYESLCIIRNRKNFQQYTFLFCFIPTASSFSLDVNATETYHLETVNINTSHSSPSHTNTYTKVNGSLSMNDSRITHARIYKLADSLEASSQKWNCGHQTYADSKSETTEVVERPIRGSPSWKVYKMDVLVSALLHLETTVCTPEINWYLDVEKYMVYAKRSPWTNTSPSYF